MTRRRTDQMVGRGGIRATTTLSRLATAMALVLVASSCSSSARSPRVSTITPPRAYTDHPLILRVGATDLRPALRLDIGGDTLRADLSSVRMTLVPATADVNGGEPMALEIVDWDGQREQAFWALTPATVPPGWYGLQVTDPRGARATISGAFEALGADPTPPTIITDPSIPPNSIMPAGMPVILAFLVDDGPGTITSVEWWTSESASGTCPPLVNRPAVPTTDKLDPSLVRQVWPHQVTCEAALLLPAVGDLGPGIRSFSFHVEARDAADQLAVLDLPLRVARGPTIVSFTGNVGALAGNQPFVVRGRDFVPGAQAFLDNVPLGGPIVGGELRAGDPGDELGNQQIVGLTPPRARAGAVTVEVHSESGNVRSVFRFNYIAPPYILEVQPTVAARSGGSRITVKGNDLRSDGVAYIGTTRDARLPLYNAVHTADNMIAGCLPPGSGTVSIWVDDPVTGEGMLADAFTYADTDATLAVLPDSSCR